MAKDDPGPSEANMWDADPRELLRVGADTDLAAIDRAATPGWRGGKKAATAFMADRGYLLSELQERLYAHGRSGGQRSVLLVVQGLDTAGKGGIARHVMGMVDPQGVALRAFGRPTPEELSHHFLWRVRRALPTPGQIGVFDRSHYEDVLVARVENLVPPTTWQKRYAEINRFEQQVADAGTTIIKVALMVSYDEQGVRLMERLDRPDKHWKYDPADVAARKKWDAYQQAYADVFARTSTDVAPWHVIPADRKWYARLAVTEMLAQALADLDLGWPTPRWQVETQRNRLATTMSDAALREAAKSAQSNTEKVARKEQQFAAAVAQARALGGAPEGRPAKADAATGKATKAKAATGTADAATTAPSAKKSKKAKKRGR